MGFKIEHRIGIQAPAADVWAILSDMPQWKRWNPIYPEAVGRLLIGERLTLTEQLPGQDARQITPIVVDWVPNAQIVWQDKSMAGLLRTTRYIEMEALSDTGCIFSNGELFSGLGARYLTRARRQALRQGFTAFGEAMKARAEAGREARAT